MDSIQPETIGKYRILSEIGKGGMRDSLWTLINNGERKWVTNKVPTLGAQEDA